MRILLVAGLCGLLPVQTAAQTQGVTLAGEGVAFFAHEGLRESRQHGQGTLVGAQARAELGKGSLAVAGLFGSLSTDPAGSEKHTLRLTRISLRVHPTPWLAMGVQIEAQRNKQKDTVAVWRLYGAVIGLTGAMGVQGLTATLDGVWYPAQSSHSSQYYSPHLRSASSLEVGLGYAPARSRINARIAYRVEVYRLEQVATLRRGGLIIGLALTLRETA